MAVSFVIFISLKTRSRRCLWNSHYPAPSFRFSYRFIGHSLRYSLLLIGTLWLGPKFDGKL